MPGSALALVLVAAVCHALWNVAARGARSEGRTFVFGYWLASGVLLAPAVVGWVLLADVPTVTSAWVWAPAVSGALHLAYGVVLQRGYVEGDLSVVYPVARGVGPLITLVVAVTLLGERPGAVAVAGAVTVLAGIAVLSVPPRGVVTGSVRGGLWWGAATGATIAAYTLWDAHSVGRLGVPPVPYLAATVPFILVALLPTVWRSRDAVGAALRADRWPVLTVAVLSPLAYVLVLEAMRLAPVALVAATRESSIVIGTALGVVLLGEPGGWRRGLGAVVVLLGIALVALG